MTKIIINNRTTLPDTVAICHILKSIQQGLDINNVSPSGSAAMVLKNGILVELKRNKTSTTLNLFDKKGSQC